MRAQLISTQFATAREFRAGKSFSSELRSSTVEFEQSSRLLFTESRRTELEGTSDRASSRLLCIRCSVVDVRRRDDVASDPNNRSSTSPRARSSERRREPGRVPSLPYFAVVRGIETCSYQPAVTVPRRRVPTCRCTSRC